MFVDRFTSRARRLYPGKSYGYNSRLSNVLFHYALAKVIFIFCHKRRHNEIYSSKISYKSMKQSKENEKHDKHTQGSFLQTSYGKEYTIFGHFFFQLLFALCAWFMVDFYLALLCVEYVELLQLLWGQVLSCLYPIN